jgi:hypothetical protein
MLQLALIVAVIAAIVLAYKYFSYKEPKDERLYQASHTKEKVMAEEKEELQQDEIHFADGTVLLVEYSDVNVSDNSYLYDDEDGNTFLTAPFNNVKYIVVVDGKKNIKEKS